MMFEVLCNIYNFQVLIGGLLAVLAGVVTAISIWKSSNLPIVESRKETLDIKKRRKDYAYFILSRDLRLLAKRAHAAEGTIKAVIGANAEVNDGTREKTILAYSNNIIDDWKFMSLLDTSTLDELLTLQNTC